MNSARLAVIDLGTNTFHLLVVEAKGNSWNELYRERIFVNLAEDGIQMIGDTARERGLDALRHFSHIIREHAVTDTMAVGTAALRTAKNADQFVNDAQQELGISIHVIDGQKEAEYINAGVMRVVPDSQDNFLIMDVGGGSVEFILSSNYQPVFSVSYPIGVAVLYDMFHHTEPMNASALDQMDQFLSHTMEDLSRAIGQFGTLGLVGASGTFEVIDSAVQNNIGKEDYSRIEKEAFFNMYNRVVPMNFEERQSDPTIPHTRTRYIVVALKLIEHVLTRFPISDIGVSRYALKEGIVREWQSNLD